MLFLLSGHKQNTCTGRTTSNSYVVDYDPFLFSAAVPLHAAEQGSYLVVKL